MSAQEWRPLNRPPGGGGSVKRARERMEAGEPPVMPEPPQHAYYEPPRSRQNTPRQQFAAPGPRQRPVENRPRPQMPPGLVPRNGQAPVGVAISRPTQVPQWPLAATIEGPDPRSNPNYQPPPGRSGPPERPPRPSQTISMLDASRIHQQMPSSFQYRQPQPAQYREGYDDDDVLSPGLSPIAQSSRPSTYSSVGTIPDFPVPAQPQPNPPRRSALGPPPTSRRGTSSYYSNASWVSPIPEESPRQAHSHGSYASSTAMPHNWDPNSPADRYDDEEVGRYRVSQEYDSYGMPTPRGDRMDQRGPMQDDDNDGRGLIRSASLGKKGKASLVTTKSSEKVDAMRADPLVPKIKPLQLERAGVEMTVPIPERKPEWPIQGTLGSPLESGTGLLDPTPSSSESETPGIARAISSNDVTKSYFPSAAPSNQKDRMLGAYDKASAVPPVLPAPNAGFSRLSAIRRPPRLDIDAVRDAEARGSLTSLPDLIRRATRLAAMMERGKRPGSRIGLNDFTSMDDLSAYNKETGSGSATGDRHKSGFSGMLAAFPPPGRENSPSRPLSTWPRPEAYGALESPKPENGGNGSRRGKRRCCGLPCWGFLLLIFVLLVVIAAAVVVPIELLVIRKPSSTTAKSSTALLQACATNSSTSCQNAGSSILISGNCACICINGFTGSTCATGNATGCSTSTFAGSEYTNVTLGDSISRLISGAGNFSIPLSEETILARFNSNNLSCVSENALVTFDGSSKLLGSGSDLVNPSSTSSSYPLTPTPTGNARRRRDGDSSTYSSYSAAPTASNSNSIIFDTSTPPSYPSSTSSYDSSPTSSPTSSSSSSQTANPTSPFPITQRTLEFARVVTLFILQEQSLDQAVTAQNELQIFFSLGAGGQMSGSIEVARNITLSSINTIDLVNLRVDLGQGLVGGQNTSDGSSKG